MKFKKILQLILITLSLTLAVLSVINLSSQDFFFKKIGHFLIEKSTREYTYEIINKWPHDEKSYTQGLEFKGSILYESSGLKGRSNLRTVNLETGKTISLVKVPKEYFAEGITILDEKIWQLTWKSKVGFIYDKKTLSLLDKFSYDSDGWGLTNNGTHIIMSDGSNNLYLYDKVNFRKLKKVEVSHYNIPIKNLNELEYIKGDVYANIYTSNKVVRIDPENGEILGWIDFSRLRPTNTLDKKNLVLNGIAYNQQSDTLFITGKFWPVLYEIKITDPK